MQEKYTYGLWGAAAGAVALAIVGFTWGDWHTSKGATQRAEAAVLTALVPACVKEVMADPAAAVELKVKRTSDYDFALPADRNSVTGSRGEPRRARPISASRSGLSSSAQPGDRRRGS